MPKRNNFEQVKSFDELSVEEAANKVQDRLFKEKKKRNKELAEEVKKLNKKNFEYEKKLILDYSKERKKAENELSQYFKEVQQMTLHEYAEAHNKADKDIIEEYKRMLYEANVDSIKNGIKQGLKKAGLEISNDGSIKFNTSALGNITDDLVKSAASVFNNYQSKVNTRLIGYVETSNNAFKKIVDANAKTSPFYKTTEYLQNVNALVEAGIVQNLEQRAFLSTVKDELIHTFDATNETLTRLVRIQNQDSTAARAGMEAYLNSFLNKTFENSEYITTAFKSTSSALEEATSLLSAEQATSLEYVVQKWLGALYSEGMSLSGVQSLASAVGQLASGNINDLVGTNIGNLIAMASKGNLATYFKDGLTEATADILMQSLVSYLQELNNSGNNVVRSQLANVFGLSISDLRAASNLNVESLVGSNLSYSGARGYLGTLLGTAGTRMSAAEMMSNIFENLTFNLGSNIVGNPLLYSLYSAGDVLGNLINDRISLKMFGSGIETSISDMLKLSALGGSAIDFAKQLIFSNAKLGLGSTLDGVYNSLGALSKSDALFSTGIGLTGSGSSESGYIGNINESNLLSGSIGGTKNLLQSNKKLFTGSETDENDVEVVIPNIYKYLITSLDNKLDTLIKLSSINANYSVIDSLGNNLTNNMNTIMGGNKVVVQANPVNDRPDLINNISENVIGIYSLLQKVVTGELQLSVRDNSPTGMMMTMGNTTWTGAMR